MSLRGYNPKWGKAPWVRAFPGQVWSPPAGLSRAAAARLARRAKKARRDRLYSALSRQFRSEDGNRHCHCCVLRRLETKKATETHHIRGRHRTLRFDVRFFSPTCHGCGRWVHDHPDEARALGLLAARGDWHREPGDAETRRIEEWMREKEIL